MTEPERIASTGLTPSAERAAFQQFVQDIQSAAQAQDANRQIGQKALETFRDDVAKVKASKP